MNKSKKGQGARGKGGLRGRLATYNLQLAGLFEIYRAHFKVWTAVQLQYRVSMIIWLIGIVIPPVVYLVVWSTVADAGDGSVGGYSRADLAAYFIVGMVVNHLSFTWHMWEYDYIIRQGLLSPRLLRPFHPIHADIAEVLSYKVVTMVVMVPTVIALVLYFKPAYSGTVGSLIASVPAVFMAFLIQFLWGWTLAMAAFWTTRINAINRMYFLGKIFLAGQLAPLAFYPPALQTFAAFTPYRWMVFPVELFLGRIPPNQIGLGLMAQFFWVMLGVLAVQKIWQAGIKRYGAVGA